MANAMVALATTTLGSAQQVITFSNIPSTGYRDLLLVVNTDISGSTHPYLQFNADAGANYSLVEAYGSGGTTASANATATKLWIGYNPFPMSNGQSTTQIHIMDYAASDKHKTVLIRTGNASTAVYMSAGRWASTSAVSSIEINTNSGGSLFASASTLSLYGIVSA